MLNGVLLFPFDAFRNSFPVDIGDTSVVISMRALESKRLTVITLCQSAARP